jgi:hypothetical protein
MARRFLERVCEATLAEWAASNRSLWSLAKWHFLYFLPLPHQQGSLRPSSAWVCGGRGDSRLRNQVTRDTRTSSIQKGL